MIETGKEPGIHANFAEYSRDRSLIWSSCLGKQDDKFSFDATVTEALPNARFKVKLPNNQEVLAYVSGKMRMHYIRILPGDKVTVEMTPYDLTQARITYRH